MGRKQNYPTRLTDAEREQLQAMTVSGDPSDRLVQRAQILLWADDGKQDNEIIQLLGVAPMTVANTRRRWAKSKRLEDLPRSGSKPMLTEEQKTMLVALASTAPPEGHDRWTTDLLALRLVELKVVDTISNETIRRMLRRAEAATSKKQRGRPSSRK